MAKSNFGEIVGNGAGVLVVLVGLYLAFKFVQGQSANTAGGTTTTTGSNPVSSLLNALTPKPAAPANTASAVNPALSGLALLAASGNQQAQQAAAATALASNAARFATPQLYSSPSVQTSDVGAGSPASQLSSPQVTADLSSLSPEDLSGIGDMYTGI
jgi:hypothetical protein